MKQLLGSKTMCVTSMALLLGVAAFVVTSVSSQAQVFHLLTIAQPLGLLGGRAVSLNPSNWFKGMTAVMSRPGGNHVTLIDHI